MSRAIARLSVGPQRARPATASSFGLLRRALADGLATAFLLAVVVGSGVMAERLSHGDAAFTLLANSLASGAGLIGIRPSDVPGFFLGQAAGGAAAIGFLRWVGAPDSRIAAHKRD